MGEVIKYGDAVKCPHCGKTLRIPDYAYNNADQYDEKVFVKTLCCGYGVTLTPVRRFILSAPKFSKPVKDDWGNVIKSFKLEENKKE